MCFVRNPWRCQLASSKQNDQSLGITSVGLHTVTRPARDQRRRDDDAVMPQRTNLPVKSNSGRVGLVADMQRLVTIRKLADRLGNRIRRVVDIRPQVPGPSSSVEAPLQRRYGRYTSFCSSSIAPTNRVTTAQFGTLGRKLHVGLRFAQESCELGDPRRPCDLTSFEPCYKISDDGIP
jgi:hypothetical protein